jgi:serine/threonine-protein kinase
MITRLGHYDIVEELGRGGMGVVYKGYESSLGRYVAIKVLSAQMAHDKVFVERFLREARAMATLNDSHIIQIYFIGQDESQTFFVMEYIDGESLSTCLKRLGKLTMSDALKILLYASQGLEAAHAQGVIHRDIKPGNIMITSRGQVKVADFGIALANHDVTSKLTNTGAFVGTPGYLSPEVCMGKPVDQRSDIFALGIVLFEMLAGQMPFHDESPLKLMLDVVQAPTPDVRALNPEVDDEAARILEKMLAKDPLERYQDCESLNADLKKHPAVRDGASLSFRPAPWAGANASNPTVVGAPTPLTPGISPRAATPPPVVSSSPRTPITGSGSAAPAAAAAAAAAMPLIEATAPRKASSTPMLGIVAGLALLAVLGWVYVSGRFGGAAPTAGTPTVVTPASVVAAVPASPIPPAPPPPPGVETQTGTDGATAAEALALADAERVVGEQEQPEADAAPEAADAALAKADGTAVDPDAPVGTVRYAHGGPNTELNRVRVRAVRVPSAAELAAREQARLQNQLAAQAAADAALAAQAPIEPVQAAAAPEAKKKKGFMCRVFNKCDTGANKKAAAGTPATHGTAAQQPAATPEQPQAQR